MSDYIKREDLLNALNAQRIEYNAAVNETIIKLPSADVVEVVRCKDCKYYEPDGVCANINFLSVRPNDYCSYAEKI